MMMDMYMDDYPNFVGIGRKSRSKSVAVPFATAPRHTKLAPTLSVSTPRHAPLVPSQSITSPRRAPLTHTPSLTSRHPPLVPVPSISSRRPPLTPSHSITSSRRPTLTPSMSITSNSHMPLSPTPSSPKLMPLGKTRSFPATKLVPDPPIPEPPCYPAHGVDSHHLYPSYPPDSPFSPSCYPTVPQSLSTTPYYDSSYAPDSPYSPSIYPGYGQPFSPSIYPSINEPPLSPPFYPSQTPDSSLSTHSLSPYHQTHRASYPSSVYHLQPPPSPSMYHRHSHPCLPPPSPTRTRNFSLPSYFHPLYTPSHPSLFPTLLPPPQNPSWSSPPSTVTSGADLLDWQDIWYRLDDGRGRIVLDGLEDRIPRTISNQQAIPQALKLLHVADASDIGYVAFDEFKYFFNHVLPEGSWERGVLLRAALDVNDMAPSFDEEPWFDMWVKLVDFVHSKPESFDFDWQRQVSRSYKRNRLPHFVFYRSELVHPRRLKDWLLTSSAADNLPNPVVIQLLSKAEKTINEADTNNDGYIEYEEFVRFVRVKSSKRSKRSEMLCRGALVVLPRTERTLKTRKYIEEYSCCPPPLVMISITMIEMAMFIYYAIDMGVPIGASGPCPTYSPLVYHPQRRYEAWRYFSYALIHSGWVHLVNNLVVQVLLGVLLELVHKWWRVLIIYMTGVIAGALAHSVFTPDYYLAGASGGVYAVEYAHLGNLFLNWSEMERPWVQLIAMILLISFDLGFAFWDTYLNPVQTNTGHMAHFGGAVAGVLVGVMILRNLRQEMWERRCWWACFVMFLVFLCTGIALNIFLPVPEYFQENVFTSLSQDRDDWLINAQSFR